MSEPTIRDAAVRIARAYTEAVLNADVPERHAQDLGLAARALRLLDEAPDAETLEDMARAIDARLDLPGTVPVRNLLRSVARFKAGGPQDQEKSDDEYHDHLDRSDA